MSAKLRRAEYGESPGGFPDDEPLPPDETEEIEEGLPEEGDEEE
jgi:hypothetical protein